MKRETQLRQIKTHLLKGFMLSSFDAFKRFGITRLSARIYDLKKGGLPITSIWKGEGKSKYKTYYLDLGLLG